MRLAEACLKIGPFNDMSACTPRELVLADLCEPECCHGLVSVIMSSLANGRSAYKVALPGIGNHGSCKDTTAQSWSRFTG